MNIQILYTEVQQLLTFYHIHFVFPLVLYIMDVIYIYIKNSRHTVRDRQMVGKQVGRERLWGGGRRMADSSYSLCYFSS